MEKEITVLVTKSLEEIEKNLKQQEFKMVDAYEMIDEYMVKKDIDTTTTPILEILEKYVLVRNVVDKEQKLVYKTKEYDKLGNILSESKISCPIIDINNGIKFMEVIGYKKICTIKNESKVYKKDDLEMAVQLINNDFIIIEIEAKGNETIEDLILKLNKYNLPISKDNYFVKKAEIVLSKGSKICG